MRNLENTILAAVVRVAAAHGHRKPNMHDITVLDDFMSDIKTRNIAFHSAVGLLDEDPTKRQAVIELLQTYAVGFPPSDEVLQHMLNVCEKLALQPSVLPRMVSDLEELIHLVRGTLLHREKLSWTEPPTWQHSSSPSKRSGGVHHDGPGRALPFYLQQAALQPVGRDRNRRPITVPNPSARECLEVGQLKNKAILERHPARLPYHVSQCKDYIDQSPLASSEALLDQQLRILTTYLDNYRSHPLVARATQFLVKAMCDGYVSKLGYLVPHAATRKTTTATTTTTTASSSSPSVSGASFSRTITVSFLPVFFKLMDSEYHCVRSHVFDAIITLGVHLVLVDSRGTVQGSMEVLEGELVYLVCCVMRRLTTKAEETDERLWQAALKCCLAVVPPSKFFLLDTRALRAFLELPTIAACHPHIHALLSEALVQKLFEGNPPLAEFASGHHSQRPSPAAGPLTEPTAAVGRPLTTAAPPSLLQPSSGPQAAIGGGGNSLMPNPIVVPRSGGTAAYYSPKVSGPGGGLPSLPGHAVVASSPSSSPLLAFPQIDESALVQELGPRYMTDLLQYYRFSFNATSRRFYFFALFGIAIHMVQRKDGQRGGGGGNQTSSSSTVADSAPRFTSAQVARAYHALAGLALHWHLHAFLLARSHTALRELSSHVTVDMDLREARAIQHIIVTVMQYLASMIDEDHALPEAAKRWLSAATDSDTTQSLAQECCIGVPQMIRDDVDGLLRRLAIKLAFQVLRAVRPQHEGDGEGGALIRALSTTNVLKIRSVCPELTGSLLVLARTKPQQALRPLAALLRRYLQSETALSQLMQLYHLILGAICTPVSGSTLLEDGDVSQLLMSGQVVVLLAAVEVIGAHNVWSLYWALRRSQVAAVCHARYVLACILSAAEALPVGGTGSSSLLSLWTKLMSDPFPAVAIVGSQRVIRISGLAAYDKYEAAISDAQRAANVSKLGNSYTMALNIWERVEADIKSSN